MRPKKGAIVCIEGEMKEKMFELPDGEKKVIGRNHEESDYVISEYDLQVSRKHLEITYIEDLDHYLVVDTSANGTYLGTDYPGFRLKKEKTYYLPPMTKLKIGNDKHIYQLQ